MLAGRTTVLLASVALAGATGLDRPAPQEDDRPIHTRIDLPSVAACGGCHRTTYEEWAESLHGRAWTNANARRATNDFEKKSCRPCHSPLPVLLTGLDRPPGFRDFNRADGVHCLSCHGLADGVAAARTIEDAPCRPRFEPRFLRADLCFPCHEPTHGAFSEYETSDAFALGIRCVDCHMQAREDSSGHGHGPSGGMNVDFVRRAVAWSAAVVEGELRVTVRNRTGHRFPGEIPSRSFLVEATVGAGEPRTVLLRKPHRGEDRPDDRLLPDEERVFRFPLSGDGAVASVRLLFRPLPLLPLEECFLLGSWRSDGSR